MSATATLNIRLPEELKEHGMQVLARQNMSISEVVRQLFCELERSQQLPDFLMQGSASGAAESRRKLLRTMVGSRRPAPRALVPPIEPEGHDWREDWRRHLLESYEGDCS